MQIIVHLSLRNLYRWLMVALCLTATPACQAARPLRITTIDALPESFCLDNSEVDPASGYGCIFAFVPPSDHHMFASNQDEGEAVISINGVLTHLYRTDKIDYGRANYVHYAFADLTRKITVTLDAVETCAEVPIGVDPGAEDPGCDYNGTLVVSSGHGKRVIKITYFRGG